MKLILVLVAAALVAIAQAQYHYRVVDVYYKNKKKTTPSPPAVTPSTPPSGGKKKTATPTPRTPPTNGTTPVVTPPPTGTPPVTTPPAADCVDPLSLVPTTGILGRLVTLSGVDLTSATTAFLPTEAAVQAFAADLGLSESLLDLPIAESIVQPLAGVIFGFHTTNVAIPPADLAGTLPVGQGVDPSPLCQGNAVVPITSDGSSVTSAAGTATIAGDPINICAPGGGSGFLYTINGVILPCETPPLSSFIG